MDEKCNIMHRVCSHLWTFKMNVKIIPFGVHRYTHTRMSNRRKWKKGHTSSSLMFGWQGRSLWPETGYRGGFNFISMSLHLHTHTHTTHRDIGYSDTHMTSSKLKISRVWKANFSLLLHFSTLWNHVIQCSSHWPHTLVRLILIKIKLKTQRLCGTRYILSAHMG